MHLFNTAHQGSVSLQTFKMLQPPYLCCKIFSTRGNFLSFDAASASLAKANVSDVVFEQS